MSLFSHLQSNMQLFVLSCVVVVVAASPARFSSEYSVEAPSPSYRALSREVPAILLDERHMEDDASSYTFQTETEDGISRQESGTVVLDGDDDVAGVAQSGSYSFTLPDGQLFEMTYVADHNGFQPQSNFLPVAPEFPHEIPQFVLDQIQKAREEDDDEARRPSAPSQGYSAP
ncbi:hypothetical protein Pmani_034080 [Petrolisthes manimaculis]|uniref:Uncharacterized protein n=1 Tax=Petrolisthes manimaculis TaxID=1843537 RepID=A0AAE1TMC0_9EUCA|nr:hypothetical protein Pmani_036213 [Petrolisthes manimaculis]KAK4293201.1 hypothetical protein Pmani_034080 [Petrolisthes manimaculis]